MLAIVMTFCNFVRNRDGKENSILLFSFNSFLFICFIS
jgi:hypothetical protein